MLRVTALMRRLQALAGSGDGDISLLNTLRKLSRRSPHALAPLEGQGRIVGGRKITTEDIFSVHRGLLKRDPGGQSVVDAYLAQGLNLEELIEQVSSQVERAPLEGPLKSLAPPALPSIIPPRFLRPSEPYRFAVMVRSHVLDDKFAHLWQQVGGEERCYDVFPLLDRDALISRLGEVNESYPEVIWNSQEQLDGLGIRSKAGAYNLLWMNGDFSLFIALKERPNYDYFILIDYDVYFTKDGTKYLNRLCDVLNEHRDGGVDGVGLDFTVTPAIPGIASELPNYRHWEFFQSAADIFPNVFRFYFPVVVLSRRAVLELFAQRQLETARQTPPDKVINCEAFVPSSLMAAGLKCLDLNDLLPGSYETDSMGLQHFRHDRLAGQPLSYACRYPTQNVEMIHAVYSDEQFLERNMGIRRSSRASLDWFAEELSAKFSSSLKPELFERFMSELDSVRTLLF